GDFAMIRPESARANPPSLHPSLEIRYGSAVDVSSHLWPHTSFRRTGDVPPAPGPDRPISRARRPGSFEGSNGSRTRERTERNEEHCRWIGSIARWRGAALRWP